MFSGFYKSIFFALLLLNCTYLLADSSEGETLEKQIWKTIKNQEWRELEGSLAPSFQYASFDEILNREQYLDHAKRISIHDYVLSNFKVTEEPEIKVVTYEVQLSENKDGKSLSSKANRLSVWKKNKDKWQWVSHVVLIPVNANDVR